MTQAMVDTGVLRDAVQLACRAPSLHNSQPWKWVVDYRGLQLFLDRDRLVESTDESGPEREAIISCGAVLDHLRVAIAAAGWTASVDRFPDPDNPDQLATVDFIPLGRTTEEHRQRADAILRRRTDRLPFAAPTNWKFLEPALSASFDATTVHLDVVPGELRPQLAEASALTESLRLYDSSYHSELAWWTAPFATADGIPHSALISATESDRVDVGRTFPVVAHRDRRADITEDRSTVLVLSTDEDRRDDALLSGEALSQVLLECTLAGLATCPVTHLTELVVSRNVINTLIERDSMPQALIRVGHAPILDEVAPMTPRRALSDVLEWRR
ncbi:MAG TPA: NAD(P)H nitroreductase [Mycobacterium sp.]|nr:NAD(P)H nitroreductase [Mycobacterium sp.]